MTYRSAPQGLATHAAATDAQQAPSARAIGRLTRRSLLTSSGLAILALNTPAALAASLSIRAAGPSDRLADTWGINTHFNWQQSVWGDEVAASDLLLELGVRNTRDMVSPRMKAQRYAFPRLAAGGCRLETMMGERVDGSTLARARETVNLRLDEIVNHYGGKSSGIFSALEGCNEPNNDGVSKATWVSQTRNLSQAIWEESKKRPGSAGIPIVGPGLDRQVGPGVPTIEQDFAALGNLSPWTDYANLHVYPRNAPSDEIDHFMAAARLAYPGGEGFHISEGGYFNSMNYTATNSPPTPEDVAARYGPRHVLEHFLRGNRRFFSYELLDDPDPELDDREDGFGYIRTPSFDSSTWSRKPIFHAMKNFLALFADPGVSFTPAGLTMSLSGGESDFRSVLVQKRSGKHYLAIWRDIQLYSWDRFERRGTMLPIAPSTISLQLGKAAPVSIFEPSASTNPVQVLGAGTSFQVQLAGDVLVAEIG